MQPTIEAEHVAVEPEVPFGLRQKVGMVLGPLLLVLCGLTLPSAGLTAQQSWMVGIVLLMSTWWICEPAPLWMTALIPLVLYPLLQIGPFGTQTPLGARLGNGYLGLVLQYFDPVNFLFMGGMFIAASMEQWGLHRRIALNIVAAIGASPRRIILGFMVATAFISLWMSNTATAVMMFPIALALLKSFEEKLGRNDPMLRRFGMALMLGVAYAASIGGMGTKIGTAPNLVFAKLATPVLKQDITFLMWLKAGLPIVLIAIPLVWCYLVRIAARIPAEEFAGGAAAIETERGKLGSMSHGEKAAMWAFIVAALMWIFYKDMDLGAFTIPGWSRYMTVGWKDLFDLKAMPAAMAKWFSGDMGEAGVAVVVGCGLLLLPVQMKPLRFALDARRAAGISWDLLLLLGGGFAMAYGIKETGLNDQIAVMLKGIGKLDTVASLLVICTITTIMTEVASNTATANVVLPLLAVSAASFGIHPVPLMFAATISASFGFMLPAGTPPNAVAFASGYITVPQMVRCGIVVDLLGVMLSMLITYSLAAWAFGVPLYQ